MSAPIDLEEVRWHALPSNEIATVRQTIAVCEIVPGDLVLIEAGVRAPADLRLLHARRLLIDEALLTGESVAAEKHEAALPDETELADRQNMACCATMLRCARPARNGVSRVTQWRAHSSRWRSRRPSIRNARAGMGADR